MSITFEDKKGGATGSWSLDSGKSYTVEVLATSSTPVGPEAILTATGFNVGDTYRWPLCTTATESNPLLFLQSVSVTANGDDGMSYDLSINYGRTNPSQEGVQEDGTKDPFSVPPVLQASGEDEEIAALNDRDGNPILNTAGDPIPGLSFVSTTQVFTVSRLEREFPRTLISAVKNHLNASIWMGFAAESVLCRNIQATRTWNEDIQSYAWDVSYEFAYKEPLEVDDETIVPGWAAVVLNAGLRQKVGADRKQIIIEGAPVSDPVPLKEDGTVAAPTDDPYYLAFNIYPTADFTAFGFPLDLFSAGTPETP